MVCVSVSLYRNSLFKTLYFALVWIFARISAPCKLLVEENFNLRNDWYEIPKSSSKFAIFRFSWTSVAGTLFKQNRVLYVGSLCLF